MAHIDRCYADTVDMIYRTCHQMSARYHVPFQDILGEANYIFVDAYRTHNPELSKFSTWLQNKLQWGLTTYLIREYRERVHVELNDLHDCIAAPPDRFFVKDFIDHLSDGGKMVVKTVIKTPKPLQRNIKWEGIEGRHQIKKVLQNYLVKLGWTANEIRTGFDEIRAALSSPPAEEKKRREPSKVLRKHKLTKAQVRLMTLKNR